MATHSSIVARKIQWTEDAGEYSPRIAKLSEILKSWRVSQSDTAEHAHTHTYTYTHLIKFEFQISSYLV